MDIFSQNKLLLRMVALLTILNVALIGFTLWSVFSHRPPPHRPPHGQFRDVSRILETELGLSDKQAIQLNTLRQDFFDKEKKVLETIRLQRDSMNDNMFSGNTDKALLTGLANRISKNEYQMEMLRIEQAEVLKSICTPEQLKKFADLVNEIRDYFRPSNQPGTR